ncbi:sine oculis-binding protein homolog isoform X2 [Penaeus indicus]|uniref:sine oculis-binding protein homolog isoform X2 n=1 Tax=Penaeus indicus TaxID=29960 RepID=UPI00300D07DC
MPRATGTEHASRGIQCNQEFAETAMNELLGLYGYGKVDSRDTLGLSLHRFASHSPPHAAAAGNSPPLRTANHSPSRQPRQSPPLSSANHSPQPHPSDHEHDADSLDSDGMPVPAQIESSARSLSPGKTEGSGSSRGSTPKSDSGGATGGGGGGTGVVLCSWCGRVCTSGGRRGGSAFQLPTTSGDRHFCSEVCFTQCRRASFKKSKVCDWCRHVRPTVTYVDFTDGDHQLQFCSDKCLNQYKMQIFCRETEAHLQMHPHLNDLKPASSSGLITPDLWLRDCSQTSEADSGPEGDVRVSSPSSPPAPATPPPASPSPSEPVNLTTQSSSRSEPRASPSLSQASSASGRAGQSRSSEGRSPGPLPAPRYGRPRLRDRRDGGREVGRPRTVRASLQMARAAHAEKSDEVRMPAIRVRQLEAQQQQHEAAAGERELPSSSSVGEGGGDVSPHPPAQPPGLPLGGLGGGLGSLLPMVGGAPLLLPHMLPHDLPRTPLLPHLLLQHPELLRPPPLRHPLLPVPPAPAPPTPAPPTAIPPPQPGPPKAPGSLLPPVTVLLPCPIPIPIPIPIPVPIPIPINTRGEASEGRPSPQKEPAGRQRPAQRKDASRSGSVIAGPVGASTSSGSAPPACAAPAPPPPPTTSSSSSEGERPPYLRPDRERRSILRYTSDVYEINGVFLQRDSAWEAPEPLQLRRALVGDPSHDSFNHQHDFDSREVSRTPSPGPAEDNKDALASLTRKREEETSTVKRLLGEDEEEVKERVSGEASDAEGPATSTAAATATTTSSPAASTSRKRHPANDHHQQPLPKKKHLLV